MNVWDRITRRGVADQVALASPFSDASHLDRVDASVIADLWNIDSSALPLGRGQAMSIPAIARIRTILCTTVARMPLLAHDAAGVIASQPSITAQPEPDQTAYATKLWLTDELFFNGVAWAGIVARDGRSGRPTRIRLIPGSRVTIDTATGTPSIDGKPADPRQLIRFDGPHEGILNYGARTMRAALAIEAAAGRMADNPVPAIELHQTEGDPLTDAEIDALIARWSAARRARTGGVAFTNQAVETKVHGAPTEQLLIEGRHAIALDLARMASVPAWTIDANQSGSSITYSNITDRMREFLDWGAGAYVSAIEARFSADDILPAGVWARFDPSDLMRGSLKEQADAFSAAQAAGLLTKDESRALWRGRPLEETPDA